MRFSPILLRELRVSSRKPSTYYSRLLVALIGFILMIWIFEAQWAWSSSTRIGMQVFWTLSWLAFLFAAFSGFFLTVDSVCREKEEGTLGLLFLTRLKGFDVGLGKLAISSLVGVVVILALAPILAIPILMGGVSGAQFFWTILVLITTLACSLCFGLMFSTLVWTGRKAGGWMLLTIFLVWLVLPLLALAWYEFGWFPIPAGFVLIGSPFFSMMSLAGGMPPVNQHGYSFGVSLVIQWLMAILAFSIASFYLPHCWQVGGKSSGKRPRGVKATMYRALSVFYPKTRRESGPITSDPFQWLALRQIGSVWGIWFSFIAIALFFYLVNGFEVNLEHEVFLFAGFLGAFILKLFLCGEAVQFAFQQRMNGGFELLLSTPIAASEVIRGVAKGFFRKYLFPTLAVIACFILGADPPFLNSDNQVKLVFWGIFFLVADMVACFCWGMFRGLWSKKVHGTSFMVIFHVMAMPWVVMWFIAAGMRFSIGLNEDSGFLMALMYFLVWSLILSLSGWNGFVRSFRSAVSGAISKVS